MSKCPKCGISPNHCVVMVSKSGEVWRDHACKDRQIATLQSELQAAREELAVARELIDRAARGGDASPGAWVQLVCEIAGFLSTSQVPGLVVVQSEALRAICNQGRGRPATEKERLAWDHLYKALAQAGKGE